MTTKIKPTRDSELPNIITALLQTRGFDCDLNDVDVSEVKDFTRVFMNSHNPEFVGDISRWDTRSATKMHQMFAHSKFNGDISNWDTSNVIDMGLMFSNSKFMGDLSRWNTSKVEAMNSMFEFVKLSCNLSNWNTASVKNTFRMFVGSTFNGDISNWDMRQCENIGQMFLAAKFTGDLSRWVLPENAQMPSVMEDAQLGLFQEPNFYHWHVLTGNRVDTILGVPQEWKDHAAMTRSVGLDMGMRNREVEQWAQTTWNEKKGISLVLPEGIDVEHVQ